MIKCVMWLVVDGVIGGTYLLITVPSSIVVIVPLPSRSNKQKACWYSSISSSVRFSVVVIFFLQICQRTKLLMFQHFCLFVSFSVWLNFQSAGLIFCSQRKKRFIDRSFKNYYYHLEADPKILGYSKSFFKVLQP